MATTKRPSVELRKSIARKGLFIHLPVSPEWRGLQPELTLGRAIIDRAILDCFEEELMEAAVDWFDVGNSDFNTVCFMANLDPHQTIDRVRLVLEALDNKEYVDNIHKRHKERLKTNTDVKNV